VAHRQSHEAIGELPGDLFSERAVLWQATVSGHLLAPLGAVHSVCLQRNRGAYR